MYRRHINVWFKIIFAYLLGINCFHAIADDWQEDFFINGFYTLDATQTNANLQLISAAGEPRLFEKDEVSLKNSIVGAQIQYQLTDRLSAFVQGTAFFDREDEFSTELDWGYLRYEFDDDLSLRVGKFQTPFLQGTELRKIGFSRLWARPVTPGNGASGYNEYKGAELFKKYSLGAHYWDIQLGLGQAKHGKADEVQNKNIKIATVRYQYAEHWLRLGLIDARYAVTTRDNRLVEGSANALLISLEAESRFDQLILNAGFSSGDAQISPDDSMEYLSIAYEQNDWTPYVMLAHNKISFERIGALDNLAGNGPPPPNAGPPTQRPPPPVGDRESYVLAAGVRWMVSEKLSIKSQLERIRTKDASMLQNGITHERGSALSIVIEGVY